MWAKGNLSEIEMTGTKEEFQNLVHGILNLSPFQNLVVEFEQDEEPFPYDFLVENLHVNMGEGPVLLKVLDSNVFISGGVAQLSAFTSFLRFDMDTDEHHHYEYFHGNESIHPDSVALVIKLKN
jgi:hypothetical protein